MAGNHATGAEMSAVRAYVAARPTEMLVRQLAANRSAARYRNPEKPKVRHHAHIDKYRPHFVREILAMRAELRRRVSGAVSGE